MQQNGKEQYVLLTCLGIDIMSWDLASNIFVPSIVHCNGFVHTMLIFTREDYFYLVLFAKFPF